LTARYTIFNVNSDPFLLRGVVVVKVRRAWNVLRATSPQTKKVSAYYNVKVTELPQDWSTFRN
jgi:hypothetical protein